MMTGHLLIYVCIEYSECQLHATNTANMLLMRYWFTIIFANMLLMRYWFTIIFVAQIICLLEVNQYVYSLHDQTLSNII